MLIVTFVICRNTLFFWLSSVVFKLERITFCGATVGFLLIGTLGWIVSKFKSVSLSLAITIFSLCSLFIIKGREPFSPFSGIWSISLLSVLILI